MVGVPEEHFSAPRGRAAVIGASAGLGVECAVALATAGAGVALVARRKDKVEALARDISAAQRVKAVGIGADVTVEADLDRTLAEAAAALGGEIDGRRARFRMALPDGERVTVQQLFHGVAHFAIAEDEHPE